MAELAAVVPLFLGAHDAAAMLGISVSELKRRTTQGDIPSVRLGRRRLYAPRQLTEYADRLIAAQDVRRERRVPLPNQPSRGRTTGVPRAAQPPLWWPRVPAHDDRGTG